MAEPRMQFIERFCVAALALLDAPDQPPQQGLDAVFSGRAGIAAAAPRRLARLPTYFRSHPVPLTKVNALFDGPNRGVRLQGRHATERSRPPWRFAVNFGLSRALLWDI